MAFDQIPSNLRVPLSYFEFNNSKAVQGTPSVNYKRLIIGQRLSTGTVAAGVPTLITNAAAADEMAGKGSMLAAMLKAAIFANQWMETWFIALDEDAAGNAAAGSVAIAGPATGAGTINLYIAGTRVRVGVASADTAADIATAIVAAITADTSLPVTAQVDGVNTAKVNITCRWKGLTGNDIDLRDSYYFGEQLPAGLTLTYVAMSGGTANPDIGNATAVFGDEWWHSIITPYTDAANLATLNDVLLDRWGPMMQMEGIAYGAFRGTLSEAGTFGNTRNDFLISIMGTNLIPTSTWEFAASVGSVAAQSLSIDPARPLQTLKIPGVLPPAVAARWMNSERNILLYDGISTYTIDAGGYARIEAQITTYQKNAYGDADESYLYVNTIATLGYIRYAFRTDINAKYPRHKLAEDGIDYDPSQPIVTPSILRRTILAKAKQLALAGILEDFEAFKEGLVVERDVNNLNRVNAYIRPDLVNQFRIFAAQIQFIL